MLALYLFFYIAIKMAFAGNTVSVMTSAVMHSDYSFRSRIDQFGVGVVFLILSILLMYLGNFDRLTLHSNSTNPIDLFLWIVAPVMGIVVGIAGGGRTKRQ